MGKEAGVSYGRGACRVDWSKCCMLQFHLHGDL